MCGLTGGVWTREGTPLSLGDLSQMTRILRHRGPDGGGLLQSRMGESGRWENRLFETDAPPEEDDRGLRDSGCGLGHRRLSIIDLATGAQPLCNEDETIWTVFNGEIYNYRELRDELRRCGHRFRTDSDTETIVHLYEEFGLAFVERLRGMFAIAVWDQPRQRLVLARDRLGQKPLYYREEPGRLLFASELKSLLVVDGAPRTLNPTAVDSYLLYQYVPHPECILEGYRKLPPAHRAVFEDGQLRVESYWQPPYPEPPGMPGLGSEQDWRDELRRRLTDAVQLRLRSDVPLGAFLSGGIDSTIIVGLMQQLAGQRIKTFSIGFPVAEFDERSFARTAAEHLGTEHHEYVVEPNALDSLPRLIWHYDEPFADSSAIPTMALSEVTRREVTVALSGDGGDELFAGYPRYRAVALAARIDRWPGFVKKILGWKLWQRIPSGTSQRSLIRRGKRFLSVLSRSREERYFDWVSIFNTHERRGLWTRAFAERLADSRAERFLAELYKQCPGRDFVTRTTCVDVLSYLPCDILTKVDIASMSYGLECRSPFLDHRVAELAARMPIELKMSGGVQKRILIETFPDLLPESLRHRPKMGFGVPINVWFRNELKPLLYDVLMSERALSRGIFREQSLRTLIDEHMSGRWDHAYRLWALLCLELWQRQYLDGRIPLQSPDSL